MPNYEAELAAAQAEKERLEQSRIDAQNNLRAIRAKKAELLKQIQSLDVAETNQKEITFTSGRKIREVTETIDTIARQKYQWEQNRNIRERFRAKSDILDIETSDALWRKTAMKHQIEGAKQLAIAGRGILGDKMGLGKTYTSIIWLDLIKSKKAIIFSPAEASTAFRKQMPRWAPDRPLFDLTSKSKAERNAVVTVLPMLDEWNILINFEAWRNDPTLLEKLAALGADAVIVDEAHSIKEPSTSAFKGVSRVVYPSDHYPGAEDTVKHVLPMSGTVFLNYPDEIWPLLYLVDKKAWPDRKAFRYDYLQQNYAGRWIFNKHNGAESKLIDELGIRFIQRSLDDAGVELPPQELRVHEIEFNEETHPNQYRAYRDLEVRSAMLMQGMDDEKVMGVEGLALLTRLRQMITWPMGIELKDPETGVTLFRCNINQSVKLDAAENLLNQCVRMEDERAVVFSQFKAPLHELHRRLQEFGISSVVLDGSTPHALREEIKRDADAQQTAAGRHKYDVILCNYKVGGQSLDFTGIRQMVIIDEEWNPGRSKQAYGRIHRMGQQYETIVHILRCPDTVDDTMVLINETKAEGIEGFNKALSLGAQYLRDKANG